MPFRWSHPVRIYRASYNVKHDLSLLRNIVDLYEEDVWGRLAPDEGGMIEMAGPQEFALLNTPARLFLPYNIDIRPGYYVQVKKPLVVGGHRGACETWLTSTASEGDTELAVNDTTGFARGDQILITGEEDHQLTTVGEVGESTLELYDTHSVDVEFAEGDTVVACNFYRVVGSVVPQHTSPIRAMTLVEILGTKGQ